LAEELSKESVIEGLPLQWSPRTIRCRDSGVEPGIPTSCRENEATDIVIVVEKPAAGIVVDVRRGEAFVESEGLSVRAGGEIEVTINTVSN
jgi:hypothetical protein